ncbi:MAG: hypothetical protein IJ338_11140 [Bacteroidaceae bacterium]|nr:hypothetical protein [Bacteroidaceae bacterium]
MKSSTLILSYLFIWIYWGVGIANTSCEAKQRRIDLIADLAFEQGISVRDPQEGIDKRCGTIYFGKLTNKKPVWILSQWASRYNLYDTILQKGKRGERFYENEGKRFSVLPKGHFRMEIRTKPEYGDHIRQFYESWPHLYIEQPFENGIPLSKYKALKYTLSAKLLYCKNYMGDAFNPNLHTCHVVSHMAIQNRNHKSENYLKSILLSIPIYDYRYPFPPGENFTDTGTKNVVTNLFVYGPAGDKIWDGTISSGNWQHANADLLPYVKEAVKLSGWKDTSLDNLQITYIIMGWESEGTFDAALEFKNLRLQAIIED